MTVKKQLFGAPEIAQAIERIADMIIAEFAGSGAVADDFILLGLFKQGVPLAHRIAGRLTEQIGYTPQVGHLDISMYRDDFGLRSALPIINETCIPFDMNAARVILVDDVLSTGRTIRAALDAVTDYGRPDLIRLAVLVDRGNREYPILADYAGLQVHPPETSKIIVNFQENDGADAICESAWSEENQ